MQGQFRPLAVFNLLMPRLIQLSDPHLVARANGRVRGRTALTLFRKALDKALQKQPDLLLVSGDCCHDETWCGYVRLRDAIDAAIQQQAASTVRFALLAGNHDHPQRLRAVLGRHWVVAPGVVDAGCWRLLLVSSHRAGGCAGVIGGAQLSWLNTQLREAETLGTFVVVALHHPPVPIGDPSMDTIGLADGVQLMDSLKRSSAVRAVLFGHIHQHWQGVSALRSDLSLLGCPSTLASFDPVQPCPLGRAWDPGGRLLDLVADGSVQERLMRWSACEQPEG